MTNSEVISNELGTKQSPIATKKVALRDIQNNNLNTALKDGSKERLLSVDGGGTPANAATVCGTKRLTPENTRTQPSPPLSKSNGVSEHFTYTRRKFELGADKRKPQSYAEKSPNNPQVQHEVSQARSHVNGKEDVNGHLVAAPDQNKVSVTQSRADIMEERFIRLQNFIKHCDEASYREHIQMLLHLSPVDLNKHAVELEKRAIQLAIVEGKEMQRVKALNVLGKSGATNNPVQVKPGM